MREGTHGELRDSTPGIFGQDSCRQRDGQRQRWEDADLLGPLKEVGDDYIVVIGDAVGDRYIAMGAIITFYEHPEQNVSVKSDRPHAKRGAKVF